MASYSYQTAPYTHFHELVDTWTKHAQAIETQVKSLSEKARVLGTPSDTPETRARLDEDERRLHELAGKTKTILKDLADEMNSRKKELSKDDLNRVTKVKTAMQNALKSYQDAVTSISKRRQQFQKPSNDTLIEFGDDDNQSDDDIQQRLQLQQQLRMNNDILIRQNEEQFVIEEQIQQVQSDVIEINHIMRDIGAIVSEQSPIIGGIEQNVIAANDNIVAGNSQLTSAAGYQKKYRKKLCWLLIIFLIIAIIIAVVIVLKVKK